MEDGNLHDRADSSLERRNGLDDISKLILRILHDAAEPLETKDIENRCKDFHSSITRIKVFYRLQNLRAEGHVRGKFIGSGKGNWVWWIQASRASKREARSELGERGSKPSAGDQFYINYGDIPSGH